MVLLRPDEAHMLLLAPLPTETTASLVKALLLLPLPLHLCTDPDVRAGCRVVLALCLLSVRPRPRASREVR